MALERTTSANSPEWNQVKLKYSTETLMMMLDQDKLAALEEEFNEHPRGIELLNFVWLMKNAMAVPEEEKPEFILGLTELFNEIDINGDQHMEWSEFTQYIIDAVLSQHRREERHGPVQSIVDIIQLSHSKVLKRFESSSVVDRSLHTGAVTSFNYSPALGLFWALEQSSAELKFYDRRSEVKATLTVPVPSPHFVVAAALSEDQGLLVAVGSDRSVHVFEQDGLRMRLLRSFATSLKIFRVWYLELHKIWLVATGSSLQKPSVRKSEFALKQLSIVSGKVLNEFIGHTDLAMDIVEVRRPMYFASASLDGKILLWSGNKTIACFSGWHDRGVRQLDYSPQAGGCIISVGYEKEIHVWNPEYSLKKCHIGRLEGHYSPVVSCKFLNNKPTCVSVDERGTVRVWDIRSLQCLQVLLPEIGKVEATSLSVCLRTDAFVVVAKRLLWYEVVKDSGCRSLSPDLVPLAIQYNAAYFQFVVLTKYDWRVYDALTGKLLRIHTEDDEQSELNGCALDFRHRVLFISDDLGHLRLYNYANGLKFNSLPLDSARVEKLTGALAEAAVVLYCPEDRIVLVACSDSSIKVFDMQDVSEPSWLRTMVGGHQGADIAHLAYSSEWSLVASASSNTIVSVWDFESGRLERAYASHESEVTALSFVTGLPVLAVSTAESRVYCYRIKPIHQSHECSLILQLGKGTITAVAELGSQLYLADTLGYLRVWNLLDALESAGVSPISEPPPRTRASYNPRRRDERNAEIDLKYWLKESRDLHLPAPAAVTAELQSHSWRAHRSAVRSVQVLSEIGGLATLAHSKVIKLWSAGGELWGKLHLSQVEAIGSWKVPIDLEQRRQQDLQQVKFILELLNEKPQFTPHSLSRLVKTQKKVSKKHPPELPTLRPTYSEKPQRKSLPVLPSLEENTLDENSNLPVQSEIADPELKLKLDALHERLKPTHLLKCSSEESVIKPTQGSTPSSTKPPANKLAQWNVCRGNISPKNGASIRSNPVLRPVIGYKPNNTLGRSPFARNLNWDIKFRVGESRRLLRSALRTESWILPSKHPLKNSTYRFA